MVSKIFAGVLFGLETQIIEVETDFSHGLSNFVIVGLADKSVQESKERIISALKNSTTDFIPKRITVNLAPANIIKSGVIFDLAIATGYLVSSEQIAPPPTNHMFLGELALDGRLRSLQGALPLVYGAKKQGFERIYLPEDNVAEASIIPGIKICGVRDINDLILQLQGSPRINTKKFEVQNKTEYSYDFGYVKGQLIPKRAIEIAVAGGHNILMNGIPGAGKTFIAKTIPSIMPELSFEESIEVSKIHSIAGLLSSKSPLVMHPPFRSPHHTSSQISLVGGGRNPRPGEITLAHRGVLFLDEFAEFSSQALETLRQPMEDKEVTISRAAYSVKFPANFMLVAAMNPCKCGYFGHPDIKCTCTTLQRQRYAQKISGPMLDRIDISLSIQKLDYENVFNGTNSDTKLVRNRIESARDNQKTRNPKEKLNSSLDQKVLSKALILSKDAEKIAQKAATTLQLSTRSYFRILRVARTIADIEGEGGVKPNHIAEAISLRTSRN